MSITMNGPRPSRYKRHSTSSQGDALVHYEPGSICWLKARDDFVDDIDSIAELPDGCYNHPAVLLWTEGSGMKAVIFLITSFNGVPLHVKHAKSKALREQHLPISPSPPHPDSGILLEIDGDPLRNTSCVKVKNVRVCTTRALRPYGARKLTAPSYDLLMKFAPAKPSSADISAVKTQRGLRSQYIKALSPSSIANTSLPAPNRSSRHKHGHVTHTSFPHTQPPRRTRQRTELEDPLLRSLLQSPHQAVSRPPRTEAIYGTFTARDHTSHLPVYTSQRPVSPSSENKFSYLGLFEVVIVLVLLVTVLGGGLYGIVMLARALWPGISKWIKKMLSGKIIGHNNFY
ncbi:hypothetical protein EV356DRAFT_104300 [Viridothelium virens]|uniref:Uncharacterized protein n=1 Tax=Viridothelium virens TaxID=1048519 RepID=A0A6A6HQ59_VIRVR|nr:hypothetical protein EV356DRAFT_104300 [Viridothelium virens]